MMKEITTGSEAKMINRNNVYRYIRGADRVTKQDIMDYLSLSLPTVRQNVNELLKEGLIEENGSFGNTGGRRAIAYSAVVRACTAVGIEISKKHLGMVILDLMGEVIAHKRVYFGYQRSREYYRRVGEEIDLMIAENEIPPEQILGVGISIQGLIAADGQSMAYGPILDNTGETLERIAEFITYPSYLFHDADSGAFAELWHSPEITHAVYVALSTNLGISVIIDRKIYTGDEKLGGKMEHMTLVPEGRQCYCGRHGCADAYCATIILANSVPEGKLKPFFEALEKGSPEQLKVWKEYIYYLSITLNNIRMTFGCDVILGGFMAKYLEPYMEEIKQLAYARNSFRTDADYLKLCNYQTEITASGAALRLLDDFIGQI